MVKSKIISAEINGIKFIPLPGVNYKYDYVDIYKTLAIDGEYKGKDWRTTYRYLVKNDLFFIIYFVFGNPTANKKFIVKACQDVEVGPKTNTLDIWGREHYKSTIITVAESVQKVLANPDERIGIFSYNRNLAKGFLRQIKRNLEFSEFLHDLFPDILYKKPKNEATTWSLDDGLMVKRKSSAKESTFEAWGLLEGMPTGKHFTHIVYDDIVVLDMVRSPDMMSKVKDQFDMSMNLGTEDGTIRIVGTTYHHQDLLASLKQLENPDGSSAYYSRLKPSLIGGKWDGEPVLLSAERIARLKLTPVAFKSQHLLDPTPDGTEVLNPDYLQYIDEELVPNNLYKFMAIDPAGDNKNDKGDAWAIMVFGVEPGTDEIGASKVFLLDAIIKPLNFSEAVECISRMYIDAGVIQRIGVEKVGLSTTEIHVSNALRKKGRFISIENKNLVLLKPAGRNKVKRIESALVWPLNNGKLFVSSSVSPDARERLRTEMEKFPYWHDDGLDAFSYLYDMIKEYTFMDEREKIELMREYGARTPVIDELVGY